MINQINLSKKLNITAQTIIYWTNKGKIPEPTVQIGKRFFYSLDEEEQIKEFFVGHTLRKDRKLYSAEERKQAERDSSKKYRDKNKIKIKKYHSEYYARPEVRERMRTYWRDYYASNTEKYKEYGRRPDVLERRKEYITEYMSRPENKAKKQEYDKKRRSDNQ